MNVTLTGKHVEITPAIREYVVEKMGRIKRHFDQPITISMVLSVEKLTHHVEANVSANGRSLFAESTHSDMYAAIDELSHTLDRQIIRNKEKQHDQRNGQPLKHLSAE